MAIAELHRPVERIWDIETTSNRAAASVVAELFWGSRSVARADELTPEHHDARLIRSRRLPSRVRNFWNDGLLCFTELFVLAARSGCLDSDDPDALLQGLPEAAARELEDRLLTTEDAADLAIVFARLEALRTDARLRSGYARLMESVWETQDAAWREEGRTSVRQTARRWQAAINHGASPVETAHAEPASGCSPEVAAMATAAAAERRLLVAPSFFGNGFCIVDAGPQTILSSAGERGGNRGALLRAAARSAAARYKTLSDPTRMAILGLLHQEPATIGEVARQLEVSQPTVSAHFAALRGAGLVREKRDGRTVRYGLDETRFDSILDEVRGLVLSRGG